MQIVNNQTNTLGALPELLSFLIAMALLASPVSVAAQVSKRASEDVIAMVSPLIAQVNSVQPLTGNKQKDRTNKSQRTKLKYNFKGTQKNIKSIQHRVAVKSGKNIVNLMKVCETKLNLLLKANAKNLPEAKKDALLSIASTLDSLSIE